MYTSVFLVFSNFMLKYVTKQKIYCEASHIKIQPPENGSGEGVNTGNKPGQTLGGKTHVIMELSTKNSRIY